MSIQVKKSHFFLILGFGIPFVLAILFFVFKDSLLPKKENINSGEVKVSGTPKQLGLPEIKSTTYEDPLGFSFSYPEKFLLDKHPEDQTNYANLELRGGAGENFRIFLSDPVSTDLEQIIKQDNELSDGSVLDSTVSDLEVKKVLVSKTNRTVMLGIWDGMLLRIEYTPSNGKEFSQVVGKIIDSLKIPETANYTDGSATQEVSSGESSQETAVIEDDSVIEEIE
ncbi:hypothetical protein HY345_01525 [Candidatus Microgenomates bacterium]|nr:hypothetical protein [Candidatus Microgenomates bacterium]